MTHARNEIRGRDLTVPQTLVYLQACVLESVRLWPTTPAILRDSVKATTWRNSEIPAGAAFLVLAGFFHRDPSTVPFANEFTPEAWLDGRARALPALVPFSAGPARCPGENLVLYIASTALANILGSYDDIQYVSSPRLSPTEPLPATVNHYSVELSAVSGDVGQGPHLRSRRG